jgi:hypothetical protein
MGSPGSEAPAAALSRFANRATGLGGWVQLSSPKEMGRRNRLSLSYTKKGGISDMAAERELTIAYREHPDRMVVPATGAYGGSSPDGNAVIAHFYVEYPSVPVSESISIPLSGLVDPTKAEVHKRSDIVREMQVTVAVAPELALKLASFFDQHGRAAIAARSEIAKAEAS